MTYLAGLREFRRLVSALLSIGSLLLYATGCNENYNRHYIRSDVDIGRVRRIAVLPFENYTSDALAGEKVRRLVITELLSRGIDVIEPGEIISILKGLGITSLGAIPMTDLRELGDFLEIESVMMGSVDTFAMSRGISVTYPDVSVNLRLVEISSGNIIWSASHTAGGPSFWTRHFGAEGATLDQTAKKLVDNVINTLILD